MMHSNYKTESAKQPPLPFCLDIKTYHYKIYKSHFKSKPKDTVLW